MLFVTPGATETALFFIPYVTVVFEKMNIIGIKSSCTAFPNCWLSLLRPRTSDNTSISPLYLSIVSSRSTPVGIVHAKIWSQTVPFANWLTRPTSSDNSTGKCPPICARTAFLFFFTYGKPVASEHPV